jgi:hypothetical protein
MHNSLKIIKTLLYSYSALHVSGTLAPIVRNLLILHIKPPVTVCRWIGSIFQLWSVTTVAFVCLWGGYTAPQTHENDSSDRPLCSSSGELIVSVRYLVYVTLKTKE